MTYAEKLKDPRWQRKRLEILQRDEFKCCMCNNGKLTLHVHHLTYEKDKEPWDNFNESLVSLCSSCHEFLHDKNIDQVVKDIAFFFGCKKEYEVVETIFFIANKSKNG